MITFNGLPKSAEAWQVHHMDGDPGNNCLANLEYVTPSQNAQYSHASLSRTSSGPSKPVMFRLVGSTEWETCPSISAAARQLGLSSAAVSGGCKTQSPTDGYMFSFPDANEASQVGEEWRPMLDPVSGACDKRRLVSSLGRITSQYGVTGRGHLSRIGYHTTTITVNGFSRSVLVHQLVAAAFFGLPRSRQHIHINHKDHNKSNNAACNLEYVTPAENRAQAFTCSPYTRKIGLKPVWSRVLGSDESWKWHASTSSAAKELGLNQGGISLCANGKTRRAGNYEFQFADMPESHPLPGEEWRDVDIDALKRDRWSRL